MERVVRGLYAGNLKPLELAAWLLRCCYFLFIG